MSCYHPNSSSYHYHDLVNSLQSPACNVAHVILSLTIQNTAPSLFSSLATSPIFTNRALYTCVTMITPLFIAFFLINRYYTTNIKLVKNVIVVATLYRIWFVVLHNFRNRSLRTVKLPNASKETVKNHSHKR